METQQRSIFFVGAGSLAEAMIKGILTAGLYTPEQIVMSNRKHPVRLQTLQSRYGVRISQDRAQEVREAGIIVLCAKPFDIPVALQEIAAFVGNEQLLISVAAGVSTALLEDGLGAGRAVIRAMPNTSSSLQESATAICAGSSVHTAQLEAARQLFAAIGVVEVVEEEAMDAVTGLSGSGPAYFYYVAEALMKAGEENGLSREVSRSLLIQTMYGAARMLRETGTDPVELRRQVTSPNGTTMAGISSLEAAQTQASFSEAVRQATHRAGEMGQQVSLAFKTQAQ